jgi:excisionase family DNA binding protein
MTELWFTIDIAAAYLGVAEGTARRLAQNGEVRAAKDGRGRWRMRMSELDAFLARKSSEERETLKKATAANTGDARHFFSMAARFGSVPLRREFMCPRPCPAKEAFLDRDCLAEGCFLEEIENV